MRREELTMKTRRMRNPGPGPLCTETRIWFKPVKLYMSFMVHFIIFTLPETVLRNI